MAQDEADLQFDSGLIADIASRLDLRPPNRDALETIAAEASRHYDVEGGQAPFEAVVASATGVGKTYILAAAIEYFAAAKGSRNFAVITPGRTILEKTLENFTVGDAKSLLGPMSFRPIVITSENFASPAMRASMDNLDEVKLYVFTVQALVKPTTKTGRRTHQFQEGLGAAFYQHLEELQDLVVFADEHHCYYGPRFSKAVRDLSPYALIGMTATPHAKTPQDQIIFRYPIALAIAERFVKTPVLVGRQDDRTDAETKLADGLRLLEFKAKAISYWSQQRELLPVNPVMLVIASGIDDADEYARILRSPDFMEGRYGNATLVVHSNSPDEALAELSKVEDAASPVRVIISVGMLKEGWDVRNVYVIASMRASVSDILTEQTLGRGLRLPFGAYTDVEILDTLEVLAHERYEDLLKRANVINKAFIDYRTRAVLRVNAQGQYVPVIERSEVSRELLTREGDAAPGVPALVQLAKRSQSMSDSLDSLKVELPPREGAPAIRVPSVKMTTITSRFSLADIIDLAPFRALGIGLSSDPETELRRTRLDATVIVGTDGFKHTELVTSRAADRVASQGLLFPLDVLRARLEEAVLAAPFVPARREQRNAVRPLIEAFLEGLGGQAPAVLSANFERAAARLLELVAREQKRFMAKPQYEEEVELTDFRPIRTARPHTSRDLTGAFSKTVAYEGWNKSLYAQAWFDSAPERSLALMLDTSDEVDCWVRLQVGDLPILWRDARQYNPDFVAVETTGAHWVVEAKRDDEMASDDVQAKREAARTWARHVNADAQVKGPWQYLLGSESDIETVKGSWPALKQLAGT